MFMLCHLCLLISFNCLVFWILSFDCSFCLIAWYLYVLLIVSINIVGLSYGALERHNVTSTSISPLNYLINYLIL